MNISLDDFLDKMGAGPFYFLNEFENAAIRSEPGRPNMKYWVKFKGGKEFPATYESGVVMEGEMALHELTKEEYDKF